jgi:hypothetical protein
MRKSSRPLWIKEIVEKKHRKIYSFVFLCFPSNPKEALNLRYRAKFCRRHASGKTSSLLPFGRGKWKPKTFSVFGSTRWFGVVKFLLTAPYTFLSPKEMVIPFV